MTSSWRLFTSSLKVRGSPTLLIKHELRTQDDGRVLGFKVCVTDFTYLWMETLDRQELVRKATHTPFDAVDNFNQFLDYLIKGLDSAPGTSLSLRSEKGRSHLVLHLKSPLPAPLKPLVWDFDLFHASESDFTREFIVPLIGSLYESQSAQSALVDKLAEKDKAIERIDTELKTHNKQITSLFDKRFYGENVSEKHRKDILMNKMRGFRPFDEETWRAERREQVSPKAKDLYKLLFEQGLQITTSSASICRDAWWEDLGLGVEVEEPSQISQPAVARRQSTIAFESTQAFSNGTRTASTQRHEMRSSSPIDAQPESNRDNEADEDSDATASTISDIESPPPKPPARGIGKIGGNRPAAVAENSGHPSSSKSASRSGGRQPDVEANESRPRGGIGKIGGPRTTTSANPDIPARHSQSDRLPLRQASNPPEETHGSAEPSRDTNQPEETAEERANKQRMALKHDLEEKRKAPSKKKRKF